MDSTELDKATQSAYDRRLKDLASDLAEQVRTGQISEIEANETMVRCQDRWSDSPWG